MYLVHAELHHLDSSDLPAGAARLILETGLPDEGVEHVVTHVDVCGVPVVGLFVLAPNLAEAERIAGRVCLRALASCPELDGFALRRCGARLVPEFYDLQLRPDHDGRDMPGHD
ncbi:hypothetical protein AB0J38_33015 [Streptomyces sp. NPDC050095]|uniref:hypothetical protein n=1 Tax=unclassified Streptomyces TaxID=2593676 RepID=UPI003414CFE9